MTSQLSQEVDRLELEKNYLEMQNDQLKYQLKQARHEYHQAIDKERSKHLEQKLLNQEYSRPVACVTYPADQL